jgi:hypothetical protein
MKLDGKATFRKDRRLNIRLSSKDLEAEAGARRGVAVSDVDREPAAQVRDRAAQRDLRSGPGGFAKREAHA